MERCAVFVDAGYVYAEGGRLCVSSTARSAHVFNFQLFIQHMHDTAEKITGCPPLRVYWYDAARNGVRTTEQLKIAEIPLVKLRLGRLNGQGQQKGVDALIFRDMITLAQNRAVTEMVLISGDEDLHAGVTAVQDLGVRVTLVGVQAAKPGSFNQSRELVLESDLHFVLSKEILTPMFILPVPPGAQVAGASSSMGENDEIPRVAVTIDQAAGVFVKKWVLGSSEQDRAELSLGRPHIPRPLDKELLRAVEDAIGESLRGNDEAHRETRRAFWAAVDSAIIVSSPA